jgi:hypothetical protein
MNLDPAVGTRRSWASWPTIGPDGTNSPSVHTTITEGDCVVGILGSIVCPGTAGFPYPDAYEYNGIA